MSNRRARKKALNRAAPYAPGGGLMYVPVGQQTGVLGTTFYGNSMKNVPVGQSALFSPGVPLPPQPNVDPLGKPVQFRYPISWNTFAVDRSLGQPDIPGFEQLRRFAKMYSGITLNERYWLDLVPRMTLNIRLRKVFVDAGAEEKNYQQELTAFKTFWEKPDGRHDLHTWLRMCLREQSQIDELYWYKNRMRGGKLQGLWIVDGAQMKPLLDDWGMLPEAPDYAYQQYPWGIPGMQYSTDMMVHYQESPATETPYGFSRVERIIMEVNQALRKKRKDLANFTEGNIPQSFMEVPDSLNWTPDQIDAFEQSWNALLAGQVQQQVRIKFLQPGMKYAPAEQYPITFDPDLFLFKIACGCYGVPVTEFGFTEDSNRATGISQEDMVYRRTIGPIAFSYAALMTSVMATDFPDQHGEMFEAYFGGYEEVEDEQKKASAIITYTNAGVLGLTDAAKLANLPIDPDAPPVGRLIVTKNGPLFLDDKEVMDAQRQAQLAGFQLAANPPTPAQGQDEEDGDEPQPGQSKTLPKNGQKQDDTKAIDRIAEALAGIDELKRMIQARNITEEANEQRTFTNTEDEARGDDSLERAVSDASSTGTRTEAGAVDPDGPSRAKAIHEEYRRWRDKALKAVSSGKPTASFFVSDVIPQADQVAIGAALRGCTTADEVRAVFERTRERDTSPKAEAASNNGGNLQQSKNAWKPRW